MKQPEVVVVGAGAAGITAALFAAGGGARTLLLERTSDGGRKILISGGGRCNVLPAKVDESRFVTDSSPNLLKKIVRSWPLREQIAFFEGEAGIVLEEEAESAKLFPASHRAREVRDSLLALASRRGARFSPDTRVTGVRRIETGWQVERENDAPLRADALVLATGGLSVPLTGSDGFGLRTARELGHTVHPTYPALTPLTAPAGPLRELAGISLEVSITATDGERRATASGGFLFTHRGYSGPAVLNVSHVAVRSRLEGRPPALLRVAWGGLRPEAWEAALRPSGSRTVLGALRPHLPERLAGALLESSRVEPARSLAELRREERLRLLEALTRFELPWEGDEGYKKAEVTGGGVDLGEIDPRTMESRLHPGLYLCGELLDAFGPIGGYNFLWAWATGRAAGMAAAGR